MTSTDLTAPVSGEVPPTRTYARREWRWEPAEAHHTDGRAGTLTIALTNRGRKVIRTEFHYYAVFPAPALKLGPGPARAFELKNERDADEPRFRCVVGGRVATCGCESGTWAAKRGDSAECKHAATLEALVAAGVV